MKKFVTHFFNTILNDKIISFIKIIIIIIIIIEYVS